MTTKSLLQRLKRDDRGAYLIEFAMVMPTFLVLMLGIFDIGVQMYAKAALSGAVEEAARSSTLESNNVDQEDVDNRVREMVGTVAPYGTLAFERTNYSNFTDVGEPENFTDSNGNGTRDPGECFEDANSNGTWNADRGGAGQGGADDVVIYRVTLTYQKLFPLWSFLGMSPEGRQEVTTVLRNQPFTTQTNSTVVVCS